MKKLILHIIVLILYIPACFSQLYQQYFDGADTINDPFSNSSIFVQIDTNSSNIWQVGSPQKIIFDSAATAPNALITDTINYYPINNQSSVQFTIVPWTTWGVLAIQWKQKLDIDTSGDGAFVEFSVDGGNTWQNAFNNPYVYNFYGYNPENVDTLANNEIAFVGTDTAWRDIWLCYSMFWLNHNDSVVVRFTLKTDSIEHNKEGWMIDNLLAHVTIVHTIDKKLTDNHLKVYPNPTSSILYIETEKIMGPHIIEEMVLVNALGQEMEKWRNIPTKFFIHTHKYEAGNYFLHIRTNLKSETVPIVIRK